MQTNADKLYQNILNPAYNPAWLGSVRKNAYQEFVTLGLPKRSNEDWSYTSSKVLDFVYEPRQRDTSSHKDLSTTLAPYLAKDAWKIVLLDGFFIAELSQLPEHQGLQYTLWDEDFKHEIKGGPDRIARTKSWPANSLEQMNIALFQNGIHLSVASDCKVDSPLQIIHVTTEKSQKQPLLPRILIDLAAHSELTVLETFVGKDRGSWTNASLDLNLGPYAKVHVAQEKLLAEESLLTQRTYLTLQEGAQAEYFQLAMGGRLNRNEVFVELNGPLAKARIDGLSLGRGTAHIDHNSTVLHKAPQTFSEQIYKALLDDSSQSVFDGKIEIAKHAQQVQAQQLSRALLLSDRASANAKPQLRIDADDVRCSHGATVGQLNAQEIFYLQSRGIPRSLAESILAKAFIRDVLGRITTQQLHAHLAQSLHTHANLEI